MAWKMEGEKVSIHIVTPADTVLTLPDGSTHELSAGEYAFEVKQK